MTDLMPPATAEQHLQDPDWQASADPAALPPLLTTPTRPGRTRGTFTMPGHQGTTTSPPADPDAGSRPVNGAASNGHLNGSIVGGAGVGAARIDAAGVDWGLVAAFRSQVADRLAQALGGGWNRSAGEGASAGTGSGGADRGEQERLGWETIEDLLADHTAEAASAGKPGWSRAQRTQIAQCVFDAVFRLGRLQPLVDDDRVENIFVLGSDRVRLQLVDGTRVAGPPVADSDEELIETLRFLANRSESNPRPFSESHPSLHMKLDGGARLAAAAWVVSRPTVVIRRHRLMADTLEAWVQRGCMSPACANFLAAAVRAQWSIVVSGPMSAGKTTLMRALCAQIPTDEAIGTFETEYELFLGEVGTHEVVIDWEARPGVGEIGPDGRAAGAFELSQALHDSFRFALSRQIVGEVRGAEVWTMIKAMESGTGSLSTTHAANAEACIRKLVTCAMEAGAHVSREVALEKIAGALQLIVQLRRDVQTQPDGQTRQSRWVSEVVMVEAGERETGYALTHLFGPSGASTAEAVGILPPAARELEAFGFDSAAYQVEADRSTR